MRRGVSSLRPRTVKEGIIQWINGWKLVSAKEKKSCTSTMEYWTTPKIQWSAQKQIDGRGATSFLWKMQRKLKKWINCFIYSKLPPFPSEWRAGLSCRCMYGFTSHHLTSNLPITIILPDRLCIFAIEIFQCVWLCSLHPSVYSTARVQLGNIRTSHPLLR